MAARPMALTLNSGSKVRGERPSRLCRVKVLRETGLTRLVTQARRVVISLRGDDLGARGPGLFEAKLHT